MVKAYAAKSAKGNFEPIHLDLGDLKSDEIEIDVTSCGICHSDLSMLDNDWGMTAYPFVGGHEVVGKVVAAGPDVLHVKPGDTVGLGWFARSCLHCDQCVGGHQNLCAAAEGTIVGRSGGFADKVRCHWLWATPLPQGLDPASAGPLFCGGITVFNPILQHHVQPTQRVGVIGIGGLGHMALAFLNKWGCEVTAFSTSDSKKDEALALGAHHFVNSKTPGALGKLAGRFHLVLNTTNARLDWDAYVTTLTPGGVLHTVGAVLDTFGVSNAFPLISGQKSLSGSPLGSPSAVRQMVEFCARHKIAPTVEYVPMADINAAFDKLRHGSPRYRIVLTN